MIAPVEPLDRQEIRKLEQKGRKEVKKQIKRLEKFEFEYVKIDSVYPNSYNPNRQDERDFELLKLSITEDGFTQPIVVRKDNREIVDGEHRWRACHHLGFSEIPVIWVDFTEAQALVSTLRHNRARGSEDVELSIQMLKDLREMGALDHAIDSLGIKPSELNVLLSDQDAPEMMAGADWSEAWIPTEIQAEAEPEKTLKDRHVSVSEDAQRMMSKFEDHLAKETSEIRKGEISKRAKTDIEKITVVLRGDTIVRVQTALGSRPSETVLDMCCKEVLVQPEVQAKLEENIYGPQIMDIVRRRTQ